MTLINKKYKDRVFRLLFADEKNKSNTLALYNALNNSSYTDENDLEITTIEDAIYIKMKNDLSFIIADRMNLYEQQSTHNPNMPLRGYLYFSSLYEKYLKTHELNIHLKKLVKIPTPKYVVFYNGIDKRPALEKLRLSDAFQIPDDSGEFEWTATVINLNHEDNRELLSRCKPLCDYTSLISKIQKYHETMPIEDAVDEAVEECIGANILRDFLIAHRSEVKAMYLAEFDEASFKKGAREEGLEEGRIEGRIEGRTELLSTQIRAKILKGKPLDVIADELEETPDSIRELYEKIVAELNND